jgi:hypothetical protein
MSLIKPKIVIIVDGDGVEKEFIISRLPATVGREICTQYPTSNIPKLGSYALSEELMLKLMTYVGIPKESGSTEPLLMLKSKALVDNHAADFEQLMRLEAAMMEYNVSFFRGGKGSTFLSGLLQTFLQSATPTLTGLLAQFLPAGKQRSKS